VQVRHRERRDLFFPLFPFFFLPFRRRTSRSAKNLGDLDQQRVVLILDHARSLGVGECFFFFFFFFFFFLPLSLSPLLAVSASSRPSSLESGNR